jgi:hypothetical protein
LPARRNQGIESTIAERADFNGTWPFAPHFFDGSGFRIRRDSRFALALPTERAR